MKKWWLGLLSLALLLATAACGGGSQEKTTLRVGATQVPHAEILNHIKPTLEKEGIQLEVRVFQDYVLPNKAVEEGELDANYFQHIPWMESTNKEQGWHLVKVTGVHIEPMGAYSKKYKSKEEIPDGATVAIPNDPTNEGRALKLLAAHGLIEVTEEPITIGDILENPRNITFVEIENATLPQAVEDQDAAIVTAAFALPAGLSEDKMILAEESDSEYYNVLATTPELADDPRIVTLYELLTSDEMADFLAEQYQGVIIPAE